MPASMVLPRPTSSARIGHAKGGTEGEQGSVYLVGVEIDLGIGERGREFLNAVRRAPLVSSCAKYFA